MASNTVSVRRSASAPTRSTCADLSDSKGSRVRSSSCWGRGMSGSSALPGTGLRHSYSTSRIAGARFFMIGLLGGTFDPIHFGHLRPAMDLLDELGLDHVRLIPCGVPPHRAAPRAHAEQRLTMLRLAVSGEPRLRVDERELRRPGPSYMVDTVLSLREELGDTPLALIIGMDALIGLATWRRWRELVDLCHLIVMERPGGTAPATGELAALVAARRVYEVADLRARAAGGLLFHRVTQLDISASRIRALVGAGKSPRYLLPEAVQDYLRAAQLYRDEKHD